MAGSFCGSCGSWVPSGLQPRKRNRTFGIPRRRATLEANLPGARDEVTNWFTKGLLISAGVFLLLTTTGVAFIELTVIPRWHPREPLDVQRAVRTLALLFLLLEASAAFLGAGAASWLIHRNGRTHRLKAIIACASGPALPLAVLLATRYLIGTGDPQLQSHLVTLVPVLAASLLGSVLVSSYSARSHTSSDRRASARVRLAASALTLTFAASSLLPVQGRTPAASDQSEALALGRPMLIDAAAGGPPCTVQTQSAEISGSLTAFAVNLGGASSYEKTQLSDSSYEVGLKHALTVGLAPALGEHFGGKLGKRLALREGISLGLDADVQVEVADLYEAQTANQADDTIFTAVSSTASDFLEPASFIYDQIEQYAPKRGALGPRVGQEFNLAGHFGINASGGLSIFNSKLAKRNHKQSGPTLLNGQWRDTSGAWHDANNHFSKKPFPSQSAILAARVAQGLSAQAAFSLGWAISGSWRHVPNSGDDELTIKYLLSGEASAELQAFIVSAQGVIKGDVEMSVTFLVHKSFLDAIKAGIGALDLKSLHNPIELNGISLEVTGSLQYDLQLDASLKHVFTADPAHPSQTTKSTSGSHAKKAPAPEAPKPTGAVDLSSSKSGNYGFRADASLDLSVPETRAALAGFLFALSHADTRNAASVTSTKQAGAALAARIRQDGGVTVTTFKTYGNEDASGISFGGGLLVFGVGSKNSFERETRMRAWHTSAGAFSEWNDCNRAIPGSSTEPTSPQVVTAEANVLAASELEKTYYATAGRYANAGELSPNGGAKSYTSDTRPFKGDPSQPNDASRVYVAIDPKSSATVILGVRSDDNECLWLRSDARSDVVEYLDNFCESIPDKQTSMEAFW